MIYGFLGTQKVLDAAIENNVPHFIYISSIDVNVGSDPIFYGSENTTIVPKKHLLGPYSKTKYEAEQIVLESNKRQLPNGKNIISILFAVLTKCFALLNRPKTVDSITSTNNDLW